MVRAGGKVQTCAVRNDWTDARVARGESGDREWAQELLREARTAFEEMGIPRYLAVVQE